jgi:hypothetical protein
MSMAAVATQMIRERTAASVPKHRFDANRRNPPPSLQDDVHRAAATLAR